MSTYIEIVNRVLRRLVETPLTANDFGNARGLQATVKDAVRDVISKINNHYHKWPFNAAQHTMSLVIGQEEYGWPVGLSEIDWNSFYIEKDQSLNIKTKKLKKISKDDWYNKLKALDDDTDPLGKNAPDYVFEAHGQGFGVSPSPDEEYVLKFRYWLIPELPVNHDDDINIPDNWDYLVVDGALTLMKMFKENAEMSQILKRDFDKDLRTMRTVLVNDYDYMQDTRVDVRNAGSNGR